MGSFSIWHWLIVLVVVLLLFGRGKIPELMGDMAKGIKSFKKGMSEEDEAAATAWASALDGADFVYWWHRNPDKKPWAVRVVRAEHAHYFYPDFVVCVEHAPGATPLQRLLETKQDTKDAARKAQHWPAAYGKVLFLTPDGQRLRWVNDDGSLGDAVKLPDMQGVYERLAHTAPA